MARSVLALIAAAVICSAAHAAQQKLTLTDGRVITGDIVKVAGGYRVRTAMGAVEYPDSQVVSVEDVVTPEMLYASRLAEIDPNSPEDHVRLGEFALQQQLLTRAREQFTEALRLRPDYERASLMLQKVEQLMERRLGEPETMPAATRPSAAIAYSPREIKDEWLLSAKDISRIRLAELRPSDRVRITIDPDVVDQFIASKQGTGDFQTEASERRFRGMSNLRKAIYILSRTDERDAAIRDGIDVLTDPRFMTDYRRVVWPIVRRSCASAECHGGPAAGGKLHLFASHGRDDRIDYTNFLILDGYVSPGGRARMIDRANPDKSLLLQFALPAHEAEFRHPEGGPSRPTFTSRQSRSYIRMLNWIMSLHRPMHPDYRLEYSPPFGMKLNFAAAKSALPGGTAAPAMPGAATAPSSATPAPAPPRGAAGDQRGR